MTFVRALFSTLFMLGASAGLMAQQPFQYLGPNECLNCHDHAAEKRAGTRKRRSRRFNESSPTRAPTPATSIH